MVGKRVPSLAPRLAKLVTSAAAERELVDRSDRVFCSPRHVHFVEMEYGIPIEHVPAALRRVHELAQPICRRRCCSPSRYGFRPPMTSRCRRRSDGPRAGSPCTSTAACRTRTTSRASRRSWTTTTGRPHWGKLHFQRAATLAAAVPAVGPLRRRSRPARPRPHVRQPLPRPRPRTVTPDRPHLGKICVTAREVGRNPPPIAPDRDASALPSPE